MMTIVINVVGVMAIMTLVATQIERLYKYLDR